MENTWAISRRGVGVGMEEVAVGGRGQRVEEWQARKTFFSMTWYLI